LILPEVKPAWKELIHTLPVDPPHGQQPSAGTQMNMATIMVITLLAMAPLVHALSFLNGIAATIVVLFLHIRFIKKFTYTVVRPCTTVYVEGGEKIVNNGNFTLNVWAANAAYTSLVNYSNSETVTFVLGYMNKIIKNEQCYQAWPVAFTQRPQTATLLTGRY
jgi:hypothetical protein